MRLIFLMIGLALAATGPVRGDSNYRLGAGPFTIENLGSPLQANTQEQQFLFRDNNGDLRLLLYYTVTEVWQYPLQILDVNLTTGAYRLVDGVFGRPGAGGTVYDPARQKIFLGSSDPGYFMEYDLASGTVRSIGLLGQRGLQYGEFGDDGWIYLGESVWAGLERYHPATDAWEDFGDLDPANHNSYYAYTVGAETNFAYAGIGQMPWYLAVVNLQTRQVTLHWKSDGDTGGAVSKAVDGGWYYRRTTSAGSNQWYQLTNGTPALIDAASVPPLVPWYKRGNVVSGAALFPGEFGVEVNLDQAYPDSGNGTNAVIRWRAVGSNDWRSVQVAGFRIKPVILKRLWPWKENVLMGFASFYGPVFTYHSASNTLTTLGRTQYSNYDALVNASNDLFFSGYTAATLRYDPTRPWTLSASSPNRNDPALNPYKTPLAMGKYHYYMARGADGMIYQACHHERNATGGELGWYDPASNTVGGRLREPFLEYDVRDLKAVLGGAKLVYSSNNNKLFVFDTASKSMEREIVPLPGIGGLDKVAEIAPGILAGVVGATYYKVDVGRGNLLLATNLPAPAFGAMAMADRRLTLGPDGYFWIYLGNALYRIDPAGGGAQKIADDNGAYNTVFQGDDLYLYGGTELRRIRNLFGGVEGSVKTNYVALSGTNDLPPFTRWALATPSIQDAVNAAAAGDTVLVSNGLYRIDSEILITNAITVASVAGAAGTVVERAAAGTNVPHHRVFKITANALLDGFTVQNGHLRGATQYGAGILMSDGTVQNCLVRSNSIFYVWPVGGGGVAVSGGTLRFCTIVSNSVGPGDGGGVHLTRAQASVPALVWSNTIAFNSGNGAGLYLAGGSVGGRVAALHNRIEYNTGGNGGGVYITGYYQALVSNCLIRFNTGGQGGGVFFSNGPNALEDCVIVSNTATLEGGGVYGSSHYGFFRVRRCTISGNSHADFPGISLGGAGDAAGDGSINFETCRITDNTGRRSVFLRGANYPVRFRNCTVAASQPIGLEATNIGYHVTGGVSSPAYPLIQNTIVYNHATNIHSPAPTVLERLLANSFTNSCSPPLTAPGFNNVTGDPQFAAPAAGNYRIKRFSPCAGSGTTNILSLYASDLDHVPYREAVSMGCYESDPPNRGALLLIR